MNPSLFSNTGI